MSIIVLLDPSFMTLLGYVFILFSDHVSFGKKDCLFADKSYDLR